MSARRILLAALLALAGLVATLAWLLTPPRLTVPPRGFIVEDVTVVNPEGPRLAHQTLRGQATLTSITPSARGETGPHAGGFALPGLIDLHVHHPPFFAVGERELFALLFLRYGVTTVRDTGSALPATLAHHAARIGQGRLAGPRVLRCGPWLDGDPPVWPGARVVRDASAAYEAVASLASDGVDCLKLYNELRGDATAAILEAAAEFGLPVIGHVPWSASLRDLPGVEVQHLMGLSLDWSGIPEQVRNRYVSDSIGQRIRHTPTLVTFAHLESLAEQVAHGKDPWTNAAWQVLPRYHREILWDPSRNLLVRAQMSMPGRLQAMREVVRDLHRAGVPVMAGTDTMNPGVVPGAALQEELAQLVEAGLSVEEAWSAATWRAGEALGIAGLGLIEAGAPADLLIFDRDPTRDLEALTSLRAVIAGGRLYPIAELEAAVRRAQAHFAGWPYEPVSMALASAGIAWLSGDGAN